MIGQMRPALQDRFPKGRRYAVAEKQRGGEASNRVSLANRDRDRTQAAGIGMHICGSGVAEPRRIYSDSCQQAREKNYQFFVNFLSTQTFIDALYR